MVVMQLNDCRLLRSIIILVAEFELIVNAACFIECIAEDVLPHPFGITRHGIANLEGYGSQLAECEPCFDFQRLKIPIRSPRNPS